MDASYAFVDGPWEHRYVAANGARFHVAEAGDGPLVLFLHGFPEFWWAWRHQLKTLADAGYRAVAMDLRGYGASDKPPTGYEAPTLAADVAGVIRSLGEEEAVVVGHGIGGWTAWTLPLLHPGSVRAVATLGAAHPAAVAAATFAHGQLRGAAAMVRLNRPFRPERAMARRSAYVERTLLSWRGADPSWPSAEERRRYAEGMAVPFVAQSAVEPFRWLSRARLHPAGRAYLAEVTRAVGVPVLHIHGSRDAIVASRTAARSGGSVAGAYTWVEIAEAGHAPHEQTPERVDRELIDWLGGLGR